MWGKGRAKRDARLRGSFEVVRPGSFFSLRSVPVVMPEPDRCELHEVALLADEEEAEELFRLARSPIGDECQICVVCKFAREYVERRLAEQSGYAPPAGEDSGASWQSLQSAIQSVRTTVRRTH